MTAPTHSEIYYSGNNSRTMFDARSAEGQDLFQQVKTVFPWASIDDVFAISTPAVHEVLNESVISCCLGAPVTRALVGKNYVLSNRKFCMNSAKSFLRVYPAWSDAYPSFLPEGCTPMFKGENLAEYGRPAPDALSSFYDCYFKGDPDVVEQHFGLDQKRGAYETFYGITVFNGEVARVKQYVYDDQTRFSDWDVVFMMHMKQLSQQTQTA